ncbi:MAG: flagellar FliJ family protein, partial [Gemmataceae bacterium]
VQTAADAARRLREAASLGTWGAYYECAAALDETLTAAQQRLAEAEKLLQEANRLRIQATQEVETLRHLRARQWQDYRKEAERQRQNNLDELGLQRWLAARKAGLFDSPDSAERGVS